MKTTETRAVMARPAFEKIKSFNEFSKYYWYRDELIKICRSLGIDSSGMKAQLNHNIREYFHGNKILPKPKKRQMAPVQAKTDIPLSLDTGLIECGFCFSQKFRGYFSMQTGIARFKFNVDMVATVKKVRETGDTAFTLGDLLDVFYGKKTYAKYDRVSLQWNKFLHDFCADPLTVHYKNKLKTAAALWAIVRNSARKKIYTSELLNEFKDEIKGV